MPARSHAGRVGRLCGRTLPTLALGTALVAVACDQPPPTASGPGAPRLQLSGSAQPIVLVGFASHPGTAEIALVESLGGQVTRRYKYIPFLAVSIPADKRDALVAAPGVVSVEDNEEMRPFGGKQITDYGVSKVAAPAAWALGFTGRNVKVGIFDSGIDVDHPDLVVAGGVDMVGDGRGLDDCNGHGTHVAGIVGAVSNGNHTVGVAPRAQLYSMRFADCNWAGATTDKMVAAMEWAIDNGMDVVNMSFGSGIPVSNVASVPSPASTSSAQRAIFQKAYDSGIVLVGASGNSSFPATTNFPYVSYPAAFPTVIAVGATDDEDRLSTFSQYGTEQELTAPGVDNLASYLVGQGREATLLVRSDGDRELASVPLQHAGMTSKSGITAPTVAVLLGLPEDYEGIDCTGKTVLVSRGHISFAEKVRHAQSAGCAAVIIHNNQPGNFNGTLGTAVDTGAGNRAWIPGQSISLEDGAYLRDQINARATTTTLVNQTGNLALLSGTSMASPHVAGVAALVLSKNPGLSPDQVRTILRSSADDLGAPGWDAMFGYGRVNALKAVQQTP